MERFFTLDFIFEMKKTLKFIEIVFYWNLLREFSALRFPFTPDNLKKNFLYFIFLLPSWWKSLTTLYSDLYCLFDTIAAIICVVAESSCFCYEIENFLIQLTKISWIFITFLSNVSQLVSRFSPIKIWAHNIYRSRILM